MPMAQSNEKLDFRALTLPSLVLAYQGQGCMAAMPQCVSADQLPTGCQVELTGFDPIPTAPLFVMGQGHKASTPLCVSAYQQPALCPGSSSMVALPVPALHGLFWRCLFLTRSLCQTTPEHGISQQINQQSRA